MWKSHYTIAIRNLLSNKIFSAINIFGLAAGLACCMLMFLFIQDELSFDKFHANGRNIYRITSMDQVSEEKNELAVTPAPWLPLMKKDYPEIRQWVRLLKDERSLIGEKGKEHSFVHDVLFTDSSLFDVFSFRLLQGNPHTALTKPNSIVLTKEVAVKIFGNADPIGKMLEVNSSYTSAIDVQVTGIAEAPPSNSSIRYGALISMSTFGDINDSWSFHMYNAFVVLGGGASKKTFEDRLRTFSTNYLSNNPAADGKYDIHLQPLYDIHLRSHLTGELEANSDIIYVYIFSGIALFVLWIACLNFMNLSTVRSLKRAKEVGMRKVIGAARIQLIKQFLFEATVVSFLALFLALFLVAVCLPVFNQISDRNIQLNINQNISWFLIVVVLTGLVGVISGIYPAMIISAFKPIEVLRGSFKGSKSGVSVRKILVVFQFVICIVLITGTIVIYKQMLFIQNKNLGFNKEKVIIANISKNTDAEELGTFKTSLRNIPGVVSVSAASTIPSAKIPINLIHNGNSTLTKNKSMQMLFVDEDFLKTMQIKLLDGRDFSKDFPTDMENGFIINRTALKELGFADTHTAIDKPFQWVLPGKILKDGKIIGVAEDFNITPLKSAVQPLVIQVLPRRFQYLYIRISSNQALTGIENKFRSFYSGRPFEYSFLDENLQAMYASEKKLEKMFGYFSGLAILIACLGILGLSVYYAQQRLKEIGIRKILGASLGSIVAGLTGEFLKPVFIAAIIATPIAWWSMTKWLQGFAYRIDISWWIFVVAGFIAMVIAMVTVCYQAISAGLANPVKSLRTD